MDPNLHTQDEAHTCWCPFVRLSDPAQTKGGAFNRLASPSDETRDVLSYDLFGGSCIGSACMAWRWAAAPVDQDTSRGFCGLAGRHLAFGA